MKKKRKTRKNTHSQFARDLFLRLVVLLDADLGDPRIEEVARKILAGLRNEGYTFADADLDDPGCISCLHLTLLSGLNQAEKVLNLAAVETDALH